MRGRGPDPLPRALAVVALVAVAAAVLQARQGLDWDRLAEPVEVHWARVLLGSVVLLVLAVAARGLLRRLRKAGSTAPGDDDEHAEPEAEPFPFLLRVLAAVLVLGTLAAAWFVIRSIQAAPPPSLGTPTPTGSPGAPPGAPDTGSTWTVLLVVAAVLLTAALVSRWLAARRQPAPDDDAPAADERAQVQRLVAAVDAAGEGLRSQADPRQAVLAAYAAMARRLSSGLARRGREARSSDTATELLDHAVEAGLVAGPPARTLTELFREARFSEHPMGEDARRRAQDCLAQVRGELAARRG